jgi:uncharacterized protein (TIGR02265 family)
MGTQDDGASRASSAKPSISYVTFRQLRATSAPYIDALDDWDQLNARIRQTPESAMIRGLFPGELLKSVPGLQAPRRRYVPFSHYPMREYLELILRGAQLLNPGMTAGNAVLLLGLEVYELFATSLAGAAIFGIAQRNFRRMTELAPKAYEVTLKPGRVDVVQVNEQDALVQLRGVWAFPDIFHAGIWLGAMRTCECEGTIVITRHSLCDVDFEVHAEPLDGRGLKRT